MAKVAISLATTAALAQSNGLVPPHAPSRAASISVTSDPPSFTGEVAECAFRLAGFMSIVESAMHAVVRQCQLRLARGEDLTVLGGSAHSGTTASYVNID